MPQAGMELLLGVENRNHVWRDLSRLVDIECRYTCLSLTQAFFSKEVVGDVNMPHSGQYVICGEQEPCVEGSLQVS